MVTVDDALASIRQSLGDQAACRIDDIQIESVPTGSLSLDIATGVGGFPRGYITEVFGEPGGGKTTLALSACIEQVARGGTAVFIDAEQKTWQGRPVELGLPEDKLILLSPRSRADTLSIIEESMDLIAKVEGGVFVLFRPYTGTLAWDVIRRLLEDDIADIIVVDSVHALTTEAEKDAGADSKTPALLARLMSQNIKAAVSDLGLARAALVFVNQYRTHFGSRYSWRESTSGYALKYYASIRISVKDAGPLKVRGQGSTGINVEAKVEKNCLAAPYEEAGFSIVWKSGVDRASDIWDAACKTGVIDTAGGYYKFNDEPLAGYKDDGKMRRPGGKEAARHLFVTQCLDWHESVREAVLETLKKEERAKQ